MPVGVVIVGGGQAGLEAAAAFRGRGLAGAVVTKLDEAVKIGGALGTLIRNRLPLFAVANGQRVPEDWHRLSANALMHRAMKGGGSTAYRVDVNDVQLVLSGMQRQAASLQGLHF